MPGSVAQSVGHLTRKSGVLGSMPSLATYFRFSFRFFMKQRIHLIRQVLFSLKKIEKIFMTVVGCSRDWCFKG